MDRKVNEFKRVLVQSFDKIYDSYLYNVKWLFYD